MTPTAGTPETGRRLDWLVVALLAAAVLLQGGTSLRHKSLTFDELTYIPRGFTYVTTGDYRLNPEHPPLAKLLGGLGLVPRAPALDTTDVSWRTADQWAFGRVTPGSGPRWVEHMGRTPRIRSLNHSRSVEAGMLMEIAHPDGSHASQCEPRQVIRSRTSSTTSLGFPP